MPVTIVVGGQWGDEGKGKIVDILSADADGVARYQGGANAGHTILIDKKQYVLHLIPSGILRNATTCYIGNGVVVDPDAFLGEIEFLNSEGIDIEGRLFLSNNAHLVTPLHILSDKASETGSNKIGTTLRGIGPAYTDKISRIGIRAIDLLNEADFKSKLHNNYELFASRSAGSNSELPSFDELFDPYWASASKLIPYLSDVTAQLQEMVRNGDNLLLEGAQGTYLDVDHGTYPYVTSSNPSAGSACSGVGIGPTKIDRVVTVFKAYTTRVGLGPFPTELEDEIGNLIRETGVEFGATTGRKRRCGWFDIPLANRAIGINGTSDIALTKLDVLDGLEEIMLCVGYKLNGEKIDYFPRNVEEMDSVVPIYETIPGWKTELKHFSSYSELPGNAKNYISTLEDYLESPIKMISVDPQREKIILR